MEIQQLRAWRSVVATGSVRGAAEALGYSPSAISQQISQLQRMTGVPLFIRSGRGLEPTEEGVALSEQIDRVLGELGTLEDFARALRAGQRSGLTIAYFSSLGPTWMPDILSRLSEEYPDTRLELFISDTYDPIRRPRPDLQLLVLPPGATAPQGCELHLLTADPFVVAMPDSHPLTDRPDIPLAELAKYDWIDNDVPGGFCRELVLTACASVGFRPTFRIQATDLSSALALVAKGIGISVVPALATTALPSGVTTRAISGPTPTRSIYALVPFGALDRPVVRSAIDYTSAIAGTV